MKIGELAKLTDCQVETIRYYEREGLLPEPARSEGNYRLYTQAHVCRSLARSAERRCQQLNALEPLAGVGLAYINRLSDLLFVAARLIARRQGIAEILWQAAAKPKA